MLPAGSSAIETSFIASWLFPFPLSKSHLISSKCTFWAGKEKHMWLKSGMRLILQEFLNFRLINGLVKVWISFVIAVTKEASVAEFWNEVNASWVSNFRRNLKDEKISEWASLTYWKNNYKPRFIPGEVVPRKLENLMIFGSSRAKLCRESLKSW